MKWHSLTVRCLHQHFLMQLDGFLHLLFRKRSFLSWCNFISIWLLINSASATSGKTYSSHSYLAIKTKSWVQVKSKVKSAFVFQRGIFFTLATWVDFATGENIINDHAEAHLLSQKGIVWQPKRIRPADFMVSTGQAETTLVVLFICKVLLQAQSYSWPRGIRRALLSSVSAWRSQGPSYISLRLCFFMHHSQRHPFSPLLSGGDGCEAGVAGEEQSLSHGPMVMN